jgi:hypothetical protein
MKGCQPRIGPQADQTADLTELEFARRCERDQPFVRAVPKVQPCAFEALAQCHAAAGICQLFMIAQHFGQAIERDATVEVMHMVDADVGREPLQDWR